MLKLIPKYLLVIAQLVISIILLITLYHFCILQTWQLAIITLVLVLLLAFSVWKLIFAKKSHLATKITCIILSLLTIGTSVIAYHYLRPVSSFVSEITTQNRTHVKLYNLLTPKLTDTDQKRTLDDCREKEIGFLSTDPYLSAAEAKLKEKIPFTVKTYDSVNSLVSAFDTGQIPAIVLDNDFYEAIQEAAASKASKAKNSVLNSEDSNSVTSETVDPLYETTFTFEITIDDTGTTSDVKITEEPFIAYISGTDSRNGIHGVARSDVNILAVVNPKQGKILLLTIPRDTYVQLHGTTGVKDKLTHAGIMGVEMSKATIEDFLGIKIDHTIKVSFATVVNVVDAIGGIEINSDTAMTLKVEGKTKKCTYVEGWQHLDGDCALRYARERKTYYTGDNHRGQNQQQVLAAIIEKISSNKSILLDSPRILKAAEDTFETSFSYEDITSFVRFQLSEGKRWQIESIQITGKGRYTGTYYMGANLPLYVMDADESSVNSAREKVDNYLNL